MTSRQTRLERHGRSRVGHWTRAEQIENAMEDETLQKMHPPLTAAERSRHGP